jgi:hypothetical protein
MKELFIVTAVSTFLVVAVLPMFAEAAATSSVNQVNVTCVRSAVAKREKFTATSYAVSVEAVRSALLIRSSALDVAWNVQERKSRSATVRDTWKAFYTSSQAARKALRQSTLAGWKQFRIERKACGTLGAIEEPDGQSIDSTL